MDEKRKEGGFKNQTLLVVDEAFYGPLAGQALFAPFYVTDIGFFPNAQYHYRSRLQGSSQAILMLCTAGAGWVSLKGGPPVDLHTGQAILLPPNIPHAYAADEAHPWSVYWLHFSGTQTAALCKALPTGSPFFVDMEATEAVQHLFHRCFELLGQPYAETGYYVACQSAAALAAELCFASRHAATQPTAKGSTAIQSAIQFMKANLHRNVTLAEVAAAASFSPSHLSFLFKTATGHSPMGYFLHMKMQAAAKQVFFTPTPIKEIAAAFGIHDPCYFSRLFKQVMGMSPLAYRNQSNG